MNIEYFLLGGLLALLVLYWYSWNMDYVWPNNTEVKQVYSFEQDFIDTCMVASDGNAAYCDCSRSLVRSDDVWGQGSGESLYDHLHEELAVICMINT
jgi:hypothetical protein